MPLRQDLHIVSVRRLGFESHLCSLVEQDYRPVDLIATEGRQMPRAERRLVHERPTSDQEPSSETESFKTSRSTFGSEEQRSGSTRTPTRTLWKKSRSSEVPASRASTPDMSVFIEPLTPPRTSVNTEPNQGRNVGWPATDQRTNHGQSNHETDQAKRIGSAATDKLLGEHQVNEQMTASQALPNAPEAIFNLPSVTNDEHPTTNTVEPASADSKRPTSTLASLFANFRSRFYGQDTQAKKEQLAVSSTTFLVGLALTELMPDYSGGNVSSIVNLYDS